MISDEKFEKARNLIYQDSSLILLHETTAENIDSIMQDGLNMVKHYNGELGRVCMHAKNDDQIKNYDYYTYRDKKTIVVFSIPKQLFSEITENSYYGSLLLNCIPQRYSVPSFNNMPNPPSGRLPANIPSKWISGIFDENSDFIENPAYIMKQPNVEKLLEESRTEILHEFSERYPAQYKSYLASIEKTDKIKDNEEIR